MTAAETGRIAMLLPKVGELLMRLIAAMGARGFAVYVGETMRTQEQQDQAIARGTTSAKQKTTWHFLGRAADLRARLANGQPDETTHNEPFFLALYEEATALGFRSLAYHVVDGKLVKLLIKTATGEKWDAGHVEFRGSYATLAEAISAEPPRKALT